jgi:acyl carrier protein
MLCHVYGPTEATTFATWFQVTGVSAGVTTIPIGQPIGNTTAYVLDRALRPVPAGGTGELFIGGDGLARGYHGQAAATADRFLPDPFSKPAGARMYRTGDKVRWGLEGNIEFVGRFDNQVKIRGYRIEPGEVDRYLQEHPQVRQAVTTVRTDRVGARTLVSYYVPEGLPSPDLPHTLRKMLRENLPEYMQPAAIQAVAALPLNYNGKIDHSALPAPDLDGCDRAEAFVAPRNEVERKLAWIWQQILGQERIGINDRFFDMGGHSLRATQLVSRIRRDFGMEIPLRAIFEKTTIAEQAELLAGDSAQSAAGSVAEIPRLSRDAHKRALA